MSDAAIPLSVKTPQFEGPIDLGTRALGLAQLAQTTQINQQRLQEERMKAKSMQEDRDDEQAIQQEFLNPAHLKAAKDDPTHRVMDWDSLRGSLQGKIRVRNLQRLDTDHLQQVRAVQDAATADRTNSTAKINEQLAHNKLIGQEIQGLEQLPDADKPAFYAGALQRLQKAGVDVGGLPANIPADGSFNQQLQAYAAAAGYTGAILSDTLKKQRADQASAAAKRAEQQATNMELDEAEKGKQRGRENAARAYLSVGNQGQHDAWMKSLPENIAQEYGNLKAYSDTSGDTVERMAQSAQQRITTGLTQQQRDEQAERDQASQAIQSARAAKERGETQNARAVDRRQWERELNKLKEEEEQTAAVRSNLENAINSGGKLYADEKGSTKNMAAVSRDEQLTADALTGRMRSQYETLTNRMKRITADKNSLGEQMGMQIGTPTADIHRALDADLARVKQIGVKGSVAPAVTPATVPAAAPPAASVPPAPAPSAPRAAAPTGKVATMDQVRAYAAKYKMSEEQAKQSVQSQGFTIR